MAAQGQLGGASAHAAATSASFARSSSRQSGSSAGRLAGSRQCIGSVRTAAAYHCTASSRRSSVQSPSASVGGTQPEIGRAPSELQSLMRISYAVFCLKKKNKTKETQQQSQIA